PTTLQLNPLSLHDALPIWPRYLDRYGGLLRLYTICAPLLALNTAGILPAKRGWKPAVRGRGAPDGMGLLSRCCGGGLRIMSRHEDRKSTRLNSSHVKISYA